MSKQLSSQKPQRKRKRIADSSSDSETIEDATSGKKRTFGDMMNADEFLNSAAQLHKQDIIDLTARETKAAVAPKKKAPPQPTAAVRSPSALAFATVRRQGTSAAVQRTRTARSADWVPVATMAAALGIKHITSVDIGRVNMGIIRVRCSDLKITHWKLLALDTLVEIKQTADPQYKFGTGTGFSHDDRVYCFSKWLAAECTDGRSFDSDLVLVERQEFSREMAALQQVVQTVVDLKKPALVVRSNEGAAEAGDPLREANLYAACQPIGADSVKTCYEPLFPRVSSAGQANRQKKAFGMGNANRDGDVTSEQYKANKKNSMMYGQAVITTPAIIAGLGASMSEEQQKRFRGAKKDDIYDAMWQLCYALDTILPCLYGRRKRGTGAPIVMFGALPQRRTRTYDGLREFMDAVGTPETKRGEIDAVLDARTPAAWYEAGCIFAANAGRDTRTWFENAFGSALNTARAPL